MSGNCRTKIQEIETLEKRPIVICVHKNITQCHYSYITKYTPTPQQICSESYQKKCRISFIKQPVNTTVQHCYRPVRKVCDEPGPRICRTTYQTHCNTVYDEKGIGNVDCRREPSTVCGPGCGEEEGEEVCHDKQVVSVRQVPQENCDLQPVKTCRFVTRLMPKLSPVHECSVSPRQVCSRKYKTIKISKPVTTLWCGDQDDDDDLKETDRSVGARVVEELINDNNLTQDIELIEDASVEEPEKNEADLIISGVANEDSEHDDEDEEFIENPFDDLKTEYPDTLTDDERQDLEDFNNAIQLELFRARVDDDFQRQDFSQFVDVEAF